VRSAAWRALVSAWWLSLCLSPRRRHRYEGLELPVGDGWRVECSGYGQTLWSTTSVQANDGTIYCVLGQRGDVDTGGDQRLEIDIEDDGDHGHAQLEGTSDELITIKQADAFGGAKVWPLWIEAHYDTTELALAPNDRSCDEHFGVN
jgi:hypothetical protein